MRKRDRELRESRIWATYVHKGTISISVSNVLKYETFRVIVDHGIRSVGVCPDPIGRPPEFSVISRGRVSSGFFWSIHRRFLFLPSTRNLSSFIFFFFRNDKLSSISVALDMFEREREKERKLLVNGEGRQSDVYSLLLTIKLLTLLFPGNVIVLFLFFSGQNTVSFAKFRIESYWRNLSLVRRLIKRCNHVNPREEIYKFIVRILRTRLSSCLDKNTRIM